MSPPAAALTLMPSGLPCLARLDPRSPILAAFALAGVTLACRHWAGLAAALIVAVILAAVARLEVRSVLGRMLALEGFMLVTLVSLPLTMPGPAAVDLAGWSFSAAGLDKAGVILAQANVIAIAVHALLGTMEPARLGQGLARLGLPWRFVALFLLTVRYVEVLRDEYGRLRQSMRARAFRPGFGPHSWKTLGWLIGMVLVRGLDRAERIDAAMRCRGWTGRPHWLVQGGFGASDAGFALAMAGALAVVGGCAWW